VCALFAAKLGYVIREDKLNLRGRSDLPTSRLSSCKKNGIDVCSWRKNETASPDYQLEVGSHGREGRRRKLSSPSDCGGGRTCISQDRRPPLWERSRRRTSNLPREKEGGGSEGVEEIEQHVEKGAGRNKLFHWLKKIASSNQRSSTTVRVSPST